MRVSRIKLAIFAAINFGIFLGLWFLYTDTLKISELLVGTAAAVLAASGMAVVEGQRFAQFSPEPRWLLLWLRMPGESLKDSLIVWGEGLKAIAGRKLQPQMHAISFAAGGDDDHSAARRALATTLTTIPPNTIVVGIDRRENIALVHFLKPAPVPEVLRRLGARE